MFIRDWSDSYFIFEVINNRGCIEIKDFLNIIILVIVEFQKYVYLKGLNDFKFFCIIKIFLGFDNSFRFLFQKIKCYIYIDIIFSFCFDF